MGASNHSVDNTGAWRRRSFLTAPLLVSMGLFAACSGSGGGKRTVAAAPPTTASLPLDLAPLSIALSRAAFAKSDTAVVSTPEHATALTAAVRGTPVLVGINEATAQELTRLGTRTLVVPEKSDTTPLHTDAEVVEVDPKNVDRSRMPSSSGDAPSAPFALLVDPAASAASVQFATAVAKSVGSSVVEVPGGDPRATGSTVAATKKAAGSDAATGVLALGAAFGPTPRLTANVATAIAAPQLPGGGQLVVPQRRMIALYGAPGTPSLGVLGEQELPAAIERAKKLAKEYEPFSDLPVMPAFELIATVASGAAGADGDYSTAVSHDVIREWVTTAGKQGVYVVLDLQPGTADFLTQAKGLEEFLKQPHVGLALDSEWRLAPGQKHFQQIGSVTADEINGVSEWLAVLTRENKLPQKAMILHQFAHGMIQNRERVRADFPELALMLHADGHGTPDLKMGTWQALQEGLPTGVQMAWKNFYDEDTPTFTPEQTFALKPRPWFVSYQ